MKALQEVRGKNPPVTASPCQPPLGKGAMGTGVRIATTSLRTVLAMTVFFARGAVRGRRRGEGTPPYGEVASSAVGRTETSAPTERLHEVRWAGRCGHRPLRRGYMKCGGRADVGIGPYGGLQEVRWGGQTRGRPPLRKCVVGPEFYPAHRRGKAPPLRAPCYAIPQKRDARRRLFFVASRLYLTCCTGPYRRQPSRQRYLRASYQQQHESPAE